LAVYAGNYAFVEHPGSPGLEVCGTATPGCVLLACSRAGLKAALLRIESAPCPVLFLFGIMVYYERNLPHWIPGGKAIFLTWRLAGSLPLGWRPKLEPNGVSTAGKKFLLADTKLDRACCGPRWLSEPRIAELVVGAIRKGESELAHYILFAFVVMPNHVHLLLRPQVELRRLTNGLKGATARCANRILHRTGTAFWQDESFDHWLRKNDDFERIKSYIERNPVTAGLVKRPEDWPWSSAFRLRTPVL
jgi:putative transposase